jgi:hypothetical protein
MNPPVPVGRDLHFSIMDSTDFPAAFLSFMYRFQLDGFVGKRIPPMDVMVDEEKLALLSFKN